jgi:hypothetical protein
MEVSSFVPKNDPSRNSLAALESSEVPHDTMTPSGCLFNHDVQQLVL